MKELKDLVAGDNVLVTSRYYRRIAKVDKVTKTQIIANNDRFRRDYAWLLFQLEKDTEVFNLTHNTRDWTFEDWREFYLKKAKEDKK